ncbi:hypothetical protein B6U90_00710 [Thermoplasmatales archaeon ex4484_6]|nr:MAG: hypothetical protein B6U90_00710 [Thermoplasmatales archaeon ex4484_6]RLF68302.1 MAG: hypothetical protein DRN57_04470 [Thermoplasmata archaeon]
MMSPMSADALLEMLEMDEIYSEAARVLLEHPPFIVLTGAGMSVESGLPPFRGPGGIWERFDPEEYGHIDTFRKDPERAWVLLGEMLSGTLSFSPNEGHRVIARLEEKGLAGPVVTQNIDGYHGIAGSRDVLEIHGNIRNIICPSCGRTEYISSRLPDDWSVKCSCGSYRRPDIVLFGEPLKEGAISRAWEAASSGMDMLIVGTSGIVMPASQLPFLVRASGGSIVEINPHDSTFSNTISDVFIRERAVKGLTMLEGFLEDRSHGSPRGFK